MIGLAQPTITNQPATQATAPGTTVTFQVGATGTEPLAYQWQKNPGNGFSDLADRTNAALDTPNVDRTLTETEMEAASGMQLHLDSDGRPPFTSVSDAILCVYQYSDGTKPAAEVTYDNLELWTSMLPVWRPEIAIQLLSTIPPKVNLTLSAAPNSSWAIERALEPTGPWTNLSALLIGTNGSAQFQDTNSTSPAGFYRARLQ